MVLLAGAATYEAIIHQPEEKIPGVTVPATSAPAAPATATMDTPTPPDRAMIISLRESNLRVIPAAQVLADRSPMQPVKDSAAMLVQEGQTLDLKLISTATAMGIPLPAKATDPPIDGTDEDMINKIRHEQGDLLKDVIADRLATDDDQVRELDNVATLALERGIAYTEATDLVDYGAPTPVQTVEAVLDRTTVVAAIAALVVIVVLAAIFIRLLVRRNRRPSKGSA